MSVIKWKSSCNDSLKDLYDLNHDWVGLSLPTLLCADRSFSKQEKWPAIDVKEDEEYITVKADLPGIKKEEIDITVDGDILSIRGERKSEFEQKDNNVHHVERSYGMFERHVRLNSFVDETKVKANYHDGVLELVLPKKSNPEVKKIAVE